MLLPNLDWTSSKPINLQLQEQIREHLEHRELRPGERLPSTRRLAELLGIHRSTVAMAYQELWAQGWIEQRPGAAPRARARLAPPQEAQTARPDLFDWDGLAAPEAEEALAAHQALEDVERRDGLINFAHLHVDPRLFPVEAFRACLARAMKRGGASLLTYGHPQGFGPLREYLARRMALHGIATSADGILLTHGAQQALDLMLRLVARPGGRVAVESPTYSLFLPLLRLRGLEPLEIPFGPEGMDLGALEAAFRRERPVLVYTMPNFQNPTGRSATQANREGLLALCGQYRVPILEDGFEEEMKYFGRVTPPIKAMDTTGLVAYCGSFSKVLFPGLRVGWLAAPRSCLDRLVALRHFSEIMPSMLPQAALHEFCERGLYDLHIGRMHRVFRRRMQTALRALRQHLDPAWARWEEPKGGYLIWLDLAAPGRARPDWARLFEAEGVKVYPGRFFSPACGHQDWIRLSISLLDEAQIQEGIRRIGAVLRRLH